MLMGKLLFRLVLISFLFFLIPFIDIQYLSIMPHERRKLRLLKHYAVPTL